MANDNKDDKAKISAAWSTRDETILIETLVQQKLAGNWGDNNPKKAAWTACQAALAGTEKPGGVPKNINAIKNRWQRVSYYTTLNICTFLMFFCSIKRNMISSRP
jgi:hypothetical protein